MIDQLIIDSVKKEDDFIDISEFLISPDIEIAKPNPILSVIQDERLIDLFTEENISMIQGQAKSRKSTLIKAICEGILKGNNKFYSTYPRNQIAIIDTEQSTYHCYKAVSMIKQMTRRSIDYFNVAELSPKQKMKLVEKYLQSNPNCGFLILDNIVHFLVNFNDVDESGELTSWLVRIKKQFNVHICNVLHENHGDSGKARGHLGTNLKNLCETIIKIEKDKNDRSKSIVSALEMRGEEFDKFCIELDYQNTPYLSDYKEYKVQKL